MRRAHTLILLWACIGLGVLIPWSCSKAPQWSPDTLVVGMVSAPNNTDPRYGLDAASLRTAQLMFNGLVRFDENAQLLPDLAESWEHLDDTTYVFHLRQGVTFHNREPFTAEDVVYTYRSILDPNSKSPRQETYKIIEDILALDRHTVKFKLKEPFSPFLASMTGSILPKSVEKAGEEFARHPIGTGPFKFKHLMPDQELSFEAFDSYYEGAPGIRHLVFKFVPDDTTRLLEFKRGTIQFTQNTISPDMIAPLSEDPAFEILRIGSTNYAYLGFNLQDPTLKDRRVREAIAMAIDVGAMIKYLLKGNGIPATGVLPPKHWAYEGHVAKYSYSPERAMALLDESGFPMKESSQGTRRLKFLYKTSQDDLARQKAELVKAYLKKIGIDIDIRTYDWATFYTDVRNGNFQMYSLEWVGINDPDIFYYLFHSHCFPPTGANRGRYSNAEADEWIEAARRTTDRTIRKELYSRIQKKLAEDLVYISLWHPDNIVLMRRGLKGFVPYPTGDFRSMWRVCWQ